MNTNIILVGFAIVIHRVSCEKFISVSDNLRKKIALEVLKVSPESTVVSPFALSLPLCVLASLAKGHAKDELMSALGIPRGSEIAKYYTSIEDEIHIMQQSNLMLKNAIYFNESLELDHRVRNISRRFNVRSDKVGYRFPKAAAKHMNQWFARETLFRVSTLVDEDDLDNTTSMVILSGVYYKFGWDTPFDPQFTKGKKFYNSNHKTSIIPMFAKIDSFDFYDDVNNNFKAVRLLMDTYGSAVTFFLPDTNGGLPELMKKFSDDPQLILGITKNLRPMYLRLYLPRMKIKTYVDWTGFLRLTGISDVFSTNSSGLEEMLQNKTDSRVYLSKVKQKVFVEMDEVGVVGHVQLDFNRRDRAAREFAAFGDDVEQLEFDHPFLFIASLRTDSREHQLLFGAFHGPQEDS